MNEASYDAIASQWDSVRTSLSEPESRIFATVLKSLQPSSRVLDLGCGTGRPVAEHFAREGMLITGVDQSAAMLDIARRRMPDHYWILSSIEQASFEGDFSAAIAWDSMFHIPRQEHADIWRRVRKSLPRGGLFALTSGGKEHPPFTDTMFDKSFSYDSHAPDAAVSLLCKVGFTVVSQEFLNQPTSGRDKGRIAIVASAA